LLTQTAEYPKAIMRANFRSKNTSITQKVFTYMYETFLRLIQCETLKRVTQLTSAYSGPLYLRFRITRLTAVES